MWTRPCLLASLPPPSLSLLVEMKEKLNHKSQPLVIGLDVCTQLLPCGQQLGLPLGYATFLDTERHEWP